MGQLMRPRYKLKIALQSVIDQVIGDSEKRLYFQPPSGTHIVYPCIIYKLSNIQSVYADNEKIMSSVLYTVTVIDRDPDSSLRDAVYELPYCRFDRSYVSNNLYHYVFEIYN